MHWAGFVTVAAESSTVGKAMRNLKAHVHEPWEHKLWNDLFRSLIWKSAKPEIWIINKLLAKERNSVTNTLVISIYCRYVTKMFMIHIVLVYGKNWSFIIFDSGLRMLNHLLCSLQPASWASWALAMRVGIGGVSWQVALKLDHNQNKEYNLWANNSWPTNKIIDLFWGRLVSQCWSWYTCLVSELFWVVLVVMYRMGSFGYISVLYIRCIKYQCWSYFEFYWYVRV